MQLPIPNRITAGKWLAELLQIQSNLADPVVLALPRGGVPVAFEVSRALTAPLDLLLVRKLGTPHFPELAMGAIASGGIKVLNQQVIQSYHITEREIQAVEHKECAELQRRSHAYRGNRSELNLANKDCIIVDDGLATGSTMKAAIEALKAQHPRSITVAVPVAPPEIINELTTKVDIVICPFQPDNFSSIGQWYEQFTQTSDEEVKTLLQQAWQQ